MRQLSLAIALFLASIAGRLPAFADVVFNDFCDVSSLTLNGSTGVLTPNVACVLRLTNDFNQSGSAFITQPISLAADASFSTTFCFRLSNPAGSIDGDGPGADGIVFAIQTQASTAGGAGGGIGFAGITPSLGVEFDTYQNFEFDDPDGNHVGIDLNGSMISAATAPVATRMNDGATLCAWVDYDGTAGTMEVRLAGDMTRPPTPLLTYAVNLPTVLGTTNAFVGFTGGTGGGSNIQDILSWQLTGDLCGGDTDGDGVGDGCDPCTNVGGARTMHKMPTKGSRGPKVIVNKINTDVDTTNDTLRIVGEFIDGTAFSQLNPLANGARVLLQKRTGAPVADMTLPGGAFSGRGTRGWKMNAKGTKWTFRDTTGAPTNGIKTMVIQDRNNSLPNRVKVVVNGRKGTYPIVSGDEPIKATVVLGGQAASEAGQCSESAFSSECSFNANGKKLTCKQ